MYPSTPMAPTHALAQVRMRPSPVSIDISTNFDPTWSVALNDTAKPAIEWLPVVSIPGVKFSGGILPLPCARAQALGQHARGQVALCARIVGLHLVAAFFDGIEKLARDLA